MSPQSVTNESGDDNSTQTSEDNNSTTDLSSD